MSIITKLIGMIALGQTAAETRLAIQTFLTGLVGVLVLALIAGLMIGALIIGLHIALYMILLQLTTLTGLESLGITIATGVAFTGMVVAFAICRLKETFTLTKQFHVEDYRQPLPSRIAGIAQAFFDGLTGRSSGYR